ncbi:acyl-CoA thioesterase [Thalassomonas haliotis]|uniref:Acyl-CoA thioesterase n=1 Tax=Thalassomonas haliotis TaxID=485448 RepID=A0ABY7VH85_9GAMM|nr:thioesterase family protein [Thalassomonas haliotis]WDE12400.1 acyl-CoA thioesterase [Thalassomonas haliotis]
MFSETITPRFSDTDALGHINNTMVPVWFEGARDPVFRLFMPELDTGNWRLILAKIDVTYHGQLFYGQDIEVRTYIGRIGGASFDVYQELWQQGEKCASGTAVMVHFCYQEQASMAIPQAIKVELEQHLPAE